MGIERAFSLREICDLSEAGGQEEIHIDIMNVGHTLAIVEC